MKVRRDQRWWLDNRFGQSGSSTRVLLLSCNDIALMLSLVGALYRKCQGGAGPEIGISGGDPGVARVAVFIEPVDGAGPPTPWQGHSGDIVYDSPAAYRVLGFVSVDP